MSSMFIQNPLHRLLFLPVSRRALDGGYAFQITLGCSGLMGGGGLVDATGYPTHLARILHHPHALRSSKQGDRVASEVQLQSRLV